MGFLDFIKEALNPRTIELFDDLYNNHYKALLFFLKVPKISNKLSFCEKKRIAENYDEILELYNNYIRREREEKRKYLIARLNKLANNYGEAFNIICQKEIQLTKDDFLTKSYSNDVYERVLSFENKIENEYNRQITIKQNLLFFDDLYDCYSNYIELYIKHKFQKGTINELTIDEKSELVENYQDIILYAVNKGEERLRYLEHKFPQGIKSYIEAKNELFVNDTYDTYGVTDVHILKREQFRHFMRGYTALEYLSLSEEEINIYQQYYDKYKKKKSWEEEQKKYAKLCRELKNEYLKGWGAYKYNIGLKLIDRRGKYVEGQYFIWQLFYRSFCLDKGLDYSLLPSMKNQYVRLGLIKRLEKHFKDYIYDEIIDYIIALQSELQDNLYIILGNSGLDDDKFIKDFNEFHFNKLKDRLLEKNISKNEHFLSESDFISIGRKSTNKSFEGNLFIVIEMITTNSHLKQLCSSVRDSVYCSPKITYISLMKCYDRDEMISIINLKKEKLEKQCEKKKEENRIEIELLRKQIEDEESARQDEAERIRIETEYQIQAQIEEEERIKKEEAEKTRLEFEAQYGVKERMKPHTLISDDCRKIYSCISNWNTLVGTFKYFYFYNYYPYKLDKEYGFQPTIREQNVRKLIWNFKNNKEKGITDFQHQNALNVFIPLMSKFLRKTFGDNLTNITLVCIPASTKKMNEDRYKEFSSVLCNTLGMINAYDYIKIESDRVARHEGGVGVQADISFDESFFRNKNILIFDDVITKGNSMIRFYREMTRLGANVICGLAIGKTKHERGDDDPIISFLQSLNNC